MSLLPPRMPPRPRSDSQTLYFRAGSSDKEYNLWIEAWADGRYSCHASWGRRGSDRSSQQTADKSGGVSLARAQSVLRELVGEKVAKGYSAGAPTLASLVQRPSAAAQPITLVACKLCGKNPAGPGRGGYCVRCYGLPETKRLEADRALARLTPKPVVSAPKPAAVDPFAPARRKIVLD